MLTEVEELIRRFSIICSVRVFFSLRISRRSGLSFQRTVILGGKQTRRNSENHTEGFSYFHGVQEFTLFVTPFDFLFFGNDLRHVDCVLFFCRRVTF